MKLENLIVATVLAVSGVAFAADQREHVHQHAEHGGVMAEANDLAYELVAQPQVLQLYVRGHAKPVDVSNATALVTLLHGKDKQQVRLLPAGDKLEAKGDFLVAADTKALVKVNMNGKTATTRFVLH